MEFDPGIRERRKQFLRADLNAERSQRGRRRRRALGRRNDVGADADHHGQAIAGHGLSLQQDAGELLPIRHDVVGPFQGVFQRFRAGTAQIGFDAEFLQRAFKRKPGGKAQRRRNRRRHVHDFENAAGKVATRRDPGALPAAPARRLLRRHEPHRSPLAIAGAGHGFGVGRPDLVEGGEAVARRSGFGTERKGHPGNSDFAAVVATLTSGPG